MTTISAADALTQLQWRYATKIFDPSRKIPADVWHALEQSLVLSPSSFGLQPWKFFVVTDPAIRQQLLPVSRNQTQVTEASHLVVFARKEGITEADVDHYLAHMAKIRQSPVDAFAGLRKMIVGFTQAPSFDAAAWADKQVYLALGVFLAMTAVMGVDACPIEGFSPPKYDEILGLKAQGYASVVVAAAGYRAANDKYAALPKVRFSTEDVVARVGE